MNAQVIASPEFVVVAPTSGRLSSLATPETAAVAGSPVAQVNGQQVAAPADGVVIAALADNAQTAPQGLPLVTVRYTGFALVGTPTPWAAGLLTRPDATGRGQVTNASGPADCAMLAPAAEAGSDPSSPAKWLCLLPKTMPATAGQTGVVVATGAVANHVIAVPVSAIAGRQGKGKVTRITTEGSQTVEVTLGQTDGSYIEITQGLSEGDQISPLAPNLDTKSPG